MYPDIYLKLNLAEKELKESKIKYAQIESELEIYKKKELSCEKIKSKVELDMKVPTK
jgi:hypothetical protein